ncbi:MAG: hypothetical protein ABIQ74_13905 [Chitinophagales bacterium]
MRTIIFLLVTVFTFGMASAQTINADLVPSVVKNKMQEKYPEARGLYWRESGPGFVEANFTINKQKCNALFVTTGAWVSTDFTITREEFPQAASDYLNKEVSADKVTRYYRSESKAKGTQYSADAKKGGTAYTFLFDKEGKLVMKGLRD